MSHHHGSHDHDPTAHASERRLAWAAGLTGFFMLAEVAGGLVSGSLALLADAGHMLVDFAGLALAVLAARLARRPADARRSYGYDRFGVLVAYSNGLVLFAVTGVIVYEAWHRLQTPAPILAGPMMIVAVAGLAVNIAAFFVLHGGDKHDLNTRGALLHVLGDLLGSIAAIAAAIIIWQTGWTPIDPILSVLVCLLILGNAWRLVRESGHVLLEGTPVGVDGASLAAHLAASVPGVENAHHVHVWMLTPRRRAATLHVRTAQGADGTAIARRVKRELRETFAIEHATVELEHDACSDDAPEGSAHGHTHAHGHAGHDHPHGAAHDHRHADEPHPHAMRPARPAVRPA